MRPSELNDADQGIRTFPAADLIKVAPELALPQGDFSTVTPKEKWGR